LDLGKAQSDLIEFKAWIDSHPSSGEAAIVAELKSRLDLSMLIQLAAGRGWPNCYKYEFPLQGAVRADLVTGSTFNRHFVLVEFEGAEENSIFKAKSAKSQQLPGWSVAVEHAFSQVSDWTWIKNDSQHSTLYQSAFGMPHMLETYLIVCGRSHFLDATDLSRLAWRCDHTQVAGLKILFWTYDQLYDACSAALSAHRMSAGTWP
jgi:hypothetical protein